MKLCCTRGKILRLGYC